MDHTAIAMKEGPVRLVRAAEVAVAQVARMARVGRAAEEVDGNVGGGGRVRRRELFGHLCMSLSR